MEDRRWSALVAGGTGLVGSLAVEWLLADALYDRVTTLVRRPPIFFPPKLDPVVVDFEKLDALPAAPVDHVFCAIGTTIKKAGTEAAFRHVDLDYAVALAKWAVRAGASQFAIISSVGADPKSSNFYLRVKGEVEEAISQQPFRSVHIFRPSILAGNRAERRVREAIAVKVANAMQFAMVGSWRKFRPIDAMTVGAAMVGAVRNGVEGRHVYHYDQIRALARKYTSERTTVVETV